MTNGELFIAENPNIEFKINGSCVWIYFDGVNHYTMPISWWEQEISLFNKIRAEIDNALSDGMIHKKTVLGIIDKYTTEKGIRNDGRGNTDI